MLLAIDTSAGSSVAVTDGERVLALVDERDSRRHAEAIGGLIRSALRTASATPADLAGVVVGVGPGPFTGLRVGIAAARAFAIGAGIPLHPLVSHDAVAATIERPTWVVTDARRREVYWSGYSALDSEGIPVRDSGPSLGPRDDVPSTREIIDAQWIPADALGVLAARHLAAARPFVDGAPLYLRSPDVTMSAANAGARRVS